MKIHLNFGTEVFSLEILFRVAGRFKVWQTIKVGTNKYLSDLKEAIYRDNISCPITHNKELFESKSFILSGKEEDIDLARVTVSELGFKRGTPYQKICKRALRYGLELCPHEVGPRLRIQYENQQKHERLLIAMAPIITDVEMKEPGVVHARHTIFSLINGNYGPWLTEVIGAPDIFYASNTIFIFKITPKSKKTA